MKKNFRIRCLEDDKTFSIGAETPNEALYNMMYTLNLNRFDKNCKIICENREYTRLALEQLGFSVLPSKTNFLFVTTEKMDGEALYKKLNCLSNISILYGFIQYLTLYRYFACACYNDLVYTLVKNRESLCRKV